MNWMDVNGTALRYELSGCGETTLVLAHEMGGALDSWDQVLPALNHARQALRYDTRGAGLSEKIGGTYDKLRPPSDIEPMATQIPEAEYLRPTQDISPQSRPRAWSRRLSTAASPSRGF